MNRLMKRFSLVAVLLGAFHGAAAAQVKYVEYFFDTDPGFGNATGIPFYYNSLDTSITLSAGISSLSAGIHRLFVRSYDTTHHSWSLATPKIFYKQPALSHVLANITAAEYFFDTDPGFGQATPITLTAGSDISFSFTGAVTTLSNGIHRLYVRSRDANGKWSHSTEELFFKSPSVSNPSVNITAAEYFFDTDPGFGQATPITLTAGSDISFSFTGAVTTLSNGIHRLYVRSRDANGKWSHSTEELFFKSPSVSNPSVNITAAEYFFDTDPGFGQATPITLTAGSDISFSFTGAVTTLSNGIHRLYVRSRDANGKWSHSTEELFFKSPSVSNPSVNITAAEYFFDTDPGFGQATPITLTAGSDISFSFTGAVTTLSDGIHRLYVRSRDANGKWSHSTEELFFKSPSVSNPSVNITAAEYFFDTDPGFGQATPITLTAGSDISFSFTGAVTTLSNGIHRLYVRSRDANGKWSISSSQLLFKEPLMNHTPGNIVQAEYFFDTDPGVGNATNITLTAGTDITIAFNPLIVSLSASAFHKLYIRTKDAYGNWSLKAFQPFYIPPAIPSPPVRLTKLEYFFDTDPGFGSGTDVPFTRTLDLTISFSASISSLSSGLHTLNVRSQDSLGRWSLTTRQLFYREVVSTHTPSNIVAAEYFLDNDPGVGMGTSVSVVAGQDITFSVNAGISGLSSGLHRFFLRSKDADGHWSLSSPQIFYKEPALSHPLSNIVKVEYFFDTDPGFGLATAASVTAGQDITIPISASISSLSPGIHRLVVRSQDANGNWSMSTPQVFYKELALSHPLVNIVKAEYFFDTDPGFGLATAASVTAGQDINLSINAAISSLSTGIHRFIFRSEDANGNWSMSTPQYFYKEAVLSHTPGYLTRLEWFWDTDPGFGSGTSVSIPSSTVDLQNQNFTVPIPTSFMTGGTQRHYLFVRSKDDWSLTTAMMVDFTGIPLPVTLLNFRALRQAERVRLEWSVVQEHEMKQYVVERSRDARAFDSIGMLPATGQKDYVLYDEHPFTGMNYYRLRQVENSGKIVYSATVSVLFSNATEVMDLYPNPASEYFNISTKMPLAGVALYDLNGKLIRRYDNLSGTYSLSGLAAGAYIVHALGEDGQVLVKPLVVKK